MGLDTTHDCWSGPYGAFHRWRCQIAKVAGFPPLDIMDGFWDAEMRKHIPPPTTGSWAQDGLVQQLYREGKLPLKWDELGDHVGDPRLVPLLSHSDCDGEIPAEQCSSIADALEELLPRLERAREPISVRNPNAARADYDGTVNATKRFIAGLRAAAAANESVEFR